MEYCKKDFLSYNLHMIKTYKFKTVSVKIIFSQPIKKENVTINNFLSDMLTYSCKNHPNKKAFSIALQDLYAMNVFSSCYRIGKAYNMDFSATFLNEDYTEEGMFEKSLTFLRDIIFEPNVIDGKFDLISFNIVKEAIKNQIESIKENTRKLSLIKMLENMGKDEVFSYHGFGYLEDLDKIDPLKLFEYYKTFIKTSKIDIYILGNIDFDNTKKIVSELFKFNTLKMKRETLTIEHHKFRLKSKKIIESYPVSQAKLSIGCKIKQLDNYERNYVLPLYNMILGGGGDSKLHINVRGKNSLCYYISASANKLDNILFITSGISNESFDKTVKLIKKEIKDMAYGKFNNDDIDKAKIKYLTMLDELSEDPFQIISTYYTMEILDADPIEKRKEKIKNVTYEEIKILANKICVDTIYLLKGDQNERD